jgi:hypothetical protein
MSIQADNKNVAREAGQIKATITERGNGLPRIGSICYDAYTDTVYTVVGWAGSGRISSHRGGVGNSVDVILEERGYAGDTTEDEWSEIESSNYHVAVAEEEEEEAE